MPDFFEIDFLDVETSKSGDAITVRYEINGVQKVHVVDGGYAALSDKIIHHVVKYYEDRPIDYMLVTHPDGDHACGLLGVLERCNVGELWMLRPWEFAEILLPRFPTYTSSDRLRSRLRSIYKHLAALEDVAVRRGIPIRAPFQGERIGAFTVMAPSFERFLNEIVVSERTPEGQEEEAVASIFDALINAGKSVVTLIRGGWGEEVFSANETSAENEMSVIQFANIANQRILLTGDGGRRALSEAADFAPVVGLALPGIDRFQVPHHGSRRNVSTDLLDRWLGPRLDQSRSEGFELFTAICSSALADKHHPRKSVERAIVHRGGRFCATEGQDIRTSQNAPLREGWTTVASRPYPTDYED